MASFFENQDLARRNTRFLVLMYALAVAGVVVAVDLVLAAAWVWQHDWPMAGPQLTMGMRMRVVPQAVWVGGALATAAVILVVSAWNVMQLAGGGAVVILGTAKAKCPSATKQK